MQTKLVCCRNAANRNSSKIEATFFSCSKCDRYSPICYCAMPTYQSTSSKTHFTFSGSTPTLVCTKLPSFTFETKTLSSVTICKQTIPYRTPNNIKSN